MQAKPLDQAVPVLNTVEAVLPLTRLYEQLLVILVALLPAFAISYIYFPKTRRYASSTTAFTKSP